MQKLFKNRLGFGAVEVVLIVAVLVVLGIVGWKAYDARQNKSVASQAPANCYTFEPGISPNLLKVTSKGIEPSCVRAPANAGLGLVNNSSRDLKVIVNGDEDDVMAFPKGVSFGLADELKTGRNTIMANPGNLTAEIWVDPPANPGATAHCGKWAEYAPTDLNFSFCVPSDWEITTVPANPNSVTVKAPDTKLFGSFYPRVVRGAVIDFYNNGDATETLAETKATMIRNTKQGIGIAKDFKDVSADGVPGLQFYFGYEGPPVVEVNFIHDGKILTISIQADTYKKATYKKIFGRMVESLRFQ